MPTLGRRDPELMSMNSVSSMTSSLSLADLGFDDFFAQQLDGMRQSSKLALAAARIVADGRSTYPVTGAHAAFAELDGTLLRHARGIRRPVVGDWVALHPGQTSHAIIHGIFERKSALVRRNAGRDPAGQVIAANVDLVLIVTAANHELNLRRLERYLTAVWDSRAKPVVVLNKIDLVQDVEPLLVELRSVTLDAPILPVSAECERGIDELRAHVPRGSTVALVGSSGVGKSSLTNRLLGFDRQRVATTDEHDKGRHTTTRRELVPLAGGGLLIDTPGMREFGLLEHDEGLDTTFADVVALVAACRFTDCRHAREPDCAIVAALEAGTLDRDRFSSYEKLRRELAASERRSDPLASVTTKRRLAHVHQRVRTASKRSPKRK